MKLFFFLVFSFLIFFCRRRLDLLPLYSPNNSPGCCVTTFESLCGPRNHAGSECVLGLRLSSPIGALRPGISLERFSGGKSSLLRANGRHFVDCPEQFCTA